MTPSSSSGTVPADRRSWRNLLKTAAIPMATGVLLAVIAKPLFGPKEPYLEDLDSATAGDDQSDLAITSTPPKPDQRPGKLQRTFLIRRAATSPPFSEPNLGSPEFSLRADSSISSVSDRPPHTHQAQRDFAQTAPASEQTKAKQARRDFAQTSRPPQTITFRPSVATPAAELDAPQIRQALAGLLPPPTGITVADAPPSPSLAVTPDLTASAPEPPLSSLQADLPAVNPAIEPLSAASVAGERPSSPDVETSGAVVSPEEEASSEPDSATAQTARAPDQLGVPVNQFVVTGSTVFDPEELAEIALTAVLNPTALDTALQETAAEEGETDDIPLCDRREPVSIPPDLRLTPSQLIRASDAIEYCYIQKKYINSGAFIAQTEITEPEDGSIEISVVEGRLESINVEMDRSGLFSLNSSYVASRLDAAISEPFNLNDLVDAVRLLEQDPLISSISTEIVPGSQTGASILNANVTQDDGFDAAVFTDNDRSPSVGSIRYGVGLSQANWLGLGDRMSFGYNFSEGSDEYSIGYTLPINARNGTLGFNFTRSESEVIEEPFTVLDIESESSTFELSYRQPLILSPTQEFALSLKASQRTSQSRFLETIAGESIPFPGTGADADGRTRITALNFGQEWITRNSQEVIALLSELSFGLDVFSATTQPIPPDSRFVLWRGQGQWVRSLNSDSSDSLFILRGSAQLADRPLVPNQQFSFGGRQTGRGYRLNTLLRDNGWFLSSEFRLPLFRLPKNKILMQIAPFFDVGGGWNRGGVPNTQFLTSTGLGLIFRLDDDITARLDWGVPLSDFNSTGSSLQDSGIHFSIRMSPF
ncbi:MAG: ShlB/FhaC/HecB family hemolysin secretion/activation protein [Leptolyngbyaceae cyanobacterium MO_188.B28]|nr:ShlB/FhaC/HecB family hemolysin secretion/activation protein [Leptolyngbyaceae cyanobacterium MO_188.B28]